MKEKYERAIFRRNKNIRIPRNWAICNGQLIKIKDNPALYSIIATFYGGDGKTTFALPNLQDSAALQCGKGVGLTNRNLAERGGAAQVTAILKNLPSHNHRVACSTEASQSDPTDAVWGAAGSLRSPVPLYNANIGNSMNIEALAETGNEMPHNNMPPFLGLQFIIAVQGIFPPRSKS